MRPEHLPMRSFGTHFDGDLDWQSSDALGVVGSGGRVEKRWSVGVVRDGGLLGDRFKKGFAIFDDHLKVHV